MVPIPPLAFKILTSSIVWSSNSILPLEDPSPCQKLSDTVAVNPPSAMVKASSISSPPLKLAFAVVVKIPPSATTNTSSTSKPPLAFKLEENVFAPAKVWVPVVISPLAAAPASGMLKVCVVPDEEIAKSVPEMPAAKVWVEPVNPFKLLIASEEQSAKAKTPEPVVVKHWSAEPSAAGSVQTVVVVIESGALSPT